MKKNLLYSLFFMLPLGAIAQITLNSSNAPTLSVLTVNDTSNSLPLLATYPNMTAATNATWDLSTVPDSFEYVSPQGPASSATFPSATFVKSLQYNFSPTLTYKVTGMYGVQSNGILLYGENIIRQALPLGSQTGNSNDSLVFPAQNVVYNTPATIVAFPSTYKTAWSTTPRYTTSFNLTIAAYALNNTPGQRVTYYTTKDSVIGWGKMRVKDKAGNATAYIDVLQMLSSQSGTDSFYLGGSPAPTALLTAFGLTQGQVTKRYSVSYLRSREFLPLVDAGYSDAALTSLKYIRLHRQRLPVPTSIISISKQNTLEVFPNPVRDHSLTVNLNGSPAKYQLINEMGRKKAEGNVPASGKIELNASLPLGNYILLIQQAEQPLQFTRIIITN